MSTVRYYTVTRSVYLEILRKGIRLPHHLKHLQAGCHVNMQSNKYIVIFLKKFKKEKKVQEAADSPEKDQTLFAP